MPVLSIVLFSILNDVSTTEFTGPARYVPGIRAWRLSMRLFHVNIYNTICLILVNTRMDNSLERLLKLAGVTQHKQMLAEAARDRYLAMFQSMIPLMTQDGRDQLAKHVDWAINTLKKNDRIVWYLRWIRPEMVDTMFVTTDETGRWHQDTDRALAVANKLTAQNAKFYNMSPQQAGTSAATVFSNRWKTNIEHFLSYQLPGIERIVWDRQSPDQLTYQMSAVERQWQEQQKEEKRALPATDEDPEYTDGYEEDHPQKLIDFGDGFAWWDLNRPYCTREGDSMGHCGNSAARDGTVFSLRKRIQKNGKNYDIPHLTFISHDGDLGEMKGRNNKKPIEKYHPYIVALLKSEHVDSISGGGYAPEENFTLSDLPDDIGDELTELKPELADLKYLYKREGLTQRVSKMIVDEARTKLNHRIEIEPSEKSEDGKFKYDYAIVDRKNDVEDLAQDNNDKELLAAVKAWNNFKDIDATLGTELLDDYILEVLQALPTEYQELILKDLRIKTDIALRPRALRRAVNDIRRNRYYQTLERAYTETYVGELGKQHDPSQMDFGFGDSETDQKNQPVLRSRQSLLDYINFLISYTDYELSEGLHQDWDETDPNKPVIFKFEIGYIIGMLTVSPDDDEEDSRNASIVREYGFSIVQDYDAFSYRNEQLDRKDNYSSLDADDLAKYKFWRHKLNDVETDRYGRSEMKPRMMDDEEPDPKDVAMQMVKLIDMNESEEEDAEDQMIAEMRRRAGIV